MANRDHLQRVFLSLGIILVCSLMTVGVVGCGQDNSSNPSFELPLEVPAPFKSSRIAIVEKSSLIDELDDWLRSATPQVTLMSPRPDEVLKSTTLSVRFQVSGLSIYKDAQWGLGPHLHLILDNQPYRPVYNPNEPFVLEDLTPGTHTLRMFASKPWHESFKNTEAYAQVTFHVLTKTYENTIDEQQPLLTYSRPSGSYGAEPVMVDYYLTHAPLHMIAQESAMDDLADWQIRLTVNGEERLLDTWQPIYIEGLKPGQNWVQLELIDENEQPIPNQFNNTARLINYNPEGQDTLAKIVRGELTLADVGSIVDPSYVPPLPPEPLTPVVVEPEQLESEHLESEQLEPEHLESEQLESASVKSLAPVPQPVAPPNPANAQSIESGAMTLTPKESSEKSGFTSSSTQSQQNRSDETDASVLKQEDLPVPLPASSLDAVAEPTVVPEDDLTPQPQVSAPSSDKTMPLSDAALPDNNRPTPIPDSVDPTIDAPTTEPRTGSDLLTRFDWYRPNSTDSRAVKQSSEATSADKTTQPLESSIPVSSPPTANNLSDSLSSDDFSIDEPVETSVPSTSSTSSAREVVPLP